MAWSYDIRTPYVRYEIHEMAEHSFGTPGGAMWSTVGSVTRMAAAEAKTYATISIGRSRQLAQSIEYGRPVYNAALNRATARFEATAPHALYVLLGTKMVAPITAKTPRTSRNGREMTPFMILPPGWSTRRGAQIAAMGGRVIRKHSVAGQRKNDFMTRALQKSLRMHDLK